MEILSNPILVPWDFTEMAENALAHAVQFAKIIKSQIFLLNVVKKEKDIDEISKKLDDVAKEIAKKHGIKPDVKAKTGSIFEAINEFATEIDAVLVIMGTHGIKGMQKFFGSYALKVIVSSKCPFLVVQDAPAQDQIKDIVFPVEFKDEDKEKLRWANYLSNYYHTKIQICAPPTTDQRLSQKIKGNVAFAKKYLESKGIDFEISYLEGKDFAAETIKFAQKISASLILIMTTKDIGLADYAFGANEQKFIANDAKIPVMCVNPRTDLKKIGSWK
jgi:nucleotide-binding universal stress UspA family protein